jgi:CBS domain-containing protein
LDGGRVFRALVWLRNKNRLRATRIATVGGEVIAYGVMAAGAIQLLFGYAGGAWMLFIGFFLKGAATSSYEQVVMQSTLDGILVRDVMRKSFDVVAPDVSLEQLLHEHVLGRNARSFAVVAAGDFAGMITLADMRRTPRSDWVTTSVYKAMTPATRLHTVAPTDSLVTVLQLMGEHDVNQLPVVHGRELVGMLDRGDVMRFIQLRKDVGEMPQDATARALEATEQPSDREVTGSRA